MIVVNKILLKRDLNGNPISLYESRLRITI